MEFQITDLLDDLQEVNVDILPYTAASETRIKELTMRKIHNINHRRSRHGLGVIRKILIAAAILTAMAIPVLAATGILFTDWTAGYQEDRGNDYDKSPLLGAGSMVWEASNWSVRICAEDATATGLTLVCEELGNPNKSGSLTASDGFWLEQWNGAAYVPLEGSVSSGSTTAIAPGGTISRQITWENTYGALPSGSYRLGQTFTFTNTGGETRELTFYAKFRIFSGEIAPYLDKYQAAFDALYNRESYHLVITRYDIHGMDYDYCIRELWKSGNNYLIQYRYYGPDGILHAPKGYMYRDGVGYALSWAAEGMDKDVTAWETADFVDGEYFDGWHITFSIIESILGEVYDDGNTIHFVEFFDDLQPEDVADTLEEALEINPFINHDYIERTYAFDDAGSLIRIETAMRDSMDPETADIRVTDILELADDTPEEIARVIEHQDLNRIPAFSWYEERTLYSTGAYLDGFVNLAEQDITSPAQIIELARAELDSHRDREFREGSEYNMVSVYRDEAQGMWKVVFRYSQSDEVCQIIFLNSHGQTVMIAVP